MKRDLVLEELVIEEAQNLRKHATKEELKKLDYENLEGNNYKYCIYGQMTGDCFSERAYKLIRKCAKKVYVPKIGNPDIIECGVLNGAPKKLDNPNYRGDYYFSPIEKFLYKYKYNSDYQSIKVKNLVKYLKGETKELKL